MRRRHVLTIFTFASSSPSSSSSSSSSLPQVTCECHFQAAAEIALGFGSICKYLHTLEGVGNHSSSSNTEHDLNHKNPDTAASSPVLFAVSSSHIHSSAPLLTWSHPAQAAEQLFNPLAQSLRSTRSHFIRSTSLHIQTISSIYFYILISRHSYHVLYRARRVDWGADYTRQVQHLTVLSKHFQVQTLIFLSLSLLFRLSVSLSLSMSR